MPAIAAAVSYIEAFKLPLREIRQRYTKSEMYLTAWRAEEQYVEMHKKMAKADKPPKDGEESDADAAPEVEDVVEGGDVELDLSKMKGKDALAYMVRAGLMAPVMPM